ncbi:unnamed protein product [Chrysodeixis includens]|uniref:SUI1 domain-containing protein n=1 Tax=Chrysodeixis includens TaxID=689277 RepID=A0A9P0BSK4_CHRIL|nr:unnamed protein product [Chrysodeixis includens]
MFAKPYKLKSNNTLKNSEKKHLAQRIIDEFPSATEEKVKDIVPVKSSCICMKLVLHSGDLVNVYTVDGVPMVIETSERLVPTVCALWKVPDLVPVLVIHSPVLPKVQGGAPVYLPGVAIPAGGVGFPLFQRSAIIALSTQDNAAACIVGRSAMSSADMLLRAAGVCLETLQVFGDQLCKDPKLIKIDRPKLGPASYSHGDITIDLTADLNQLSIQPAVKEEWPSLGRPARHEQAPAAAQFEPKLIAAELTPCEAEKGAHEEGEKPAELDDTMVTDCSQMEEDDNDDIPTDMDGLLRWCLLTFMKLDGKNIELPLKTNLLYKNNLMPMCPSDRTLDVKKSSYKKLSKFLEEMQKEGLVELRELEKGVCAVTALALAAPALRAHRARRPAPVAAPAATSALTDHYQPPLVREMFCVTANVADVFAPLKKGTPLTAAEVRTTLTEYVKTRNLTSTQVKGAVTLDTALAKITGKQLQEAVKWDMLMSSVQAKMTPSTEMRFSDGTVKLSKSKLEPIKMQVATRSGNKKVTLVSNLEQFGFSLAALSHVCQLGVAASCGVTRAPGAKADQLMLQGDQVGTQLATRYYYINDIINTVKQLINCLTF